jgi:hypothetical protein
MRDCIVKNNRANGDIAVGGGGGVYVYSSGTVVIERSSIFNNNSASKGGGLFLGRGLTLQIVDSTISGNQAAYNGGGVCFLGGATPRSSIRNSTVSGNVAAICGGGLYLYNIRELPIANSTIAGNTSATRGGGIATTIWNYTGGDNVVLNSAIIAGNSAGNGADLSFYSSHPIVSNNSLIGVANSGGFTLTGIGNLTGTLAVPLNALLGPLADNGGPTKTHALLPGSPAINAGNITVGLAFDQRGPNHPRVVGSAADIGAFEIGPPAVSSVVVDDGSTQRSRITSLSVVFSTQVTFAGAVGNSFTLTRIGGGAVNFTATAIVIGGVTVVTLTGFTGNETQFGSLADGRYTLTALASQISAGGLGLDGNGDGTPGDNFNFGDAQGLFRFFGDINGDRHVDIADFGLLSSTFNLHAGQTGFLAAFDFNGDGVIDIADFGQFSIRFFTPLP